MTKYYCFWVDDEPYASLVGELDEDQIGRLVSLKGGNNWTIVDAVDGQHAVQLMVRSKLED